MTSGRGGHGGEGFSLEVAELEHVADAFGGGFDVAIQHRGVGEDAEGVGGSVDFEPFVVADLALEDFVVDAVVEDFGAAAGEGAEAGVAEGGEDVSDGEARDAGEVDELDGGEGFDVE